MKNRIFLCLMLCAFAFGAGAQIELNNRPVWVETPTTDIPPDSCIAVLGTNIAIGGHAAFETVVIDTVPPGYPILPYFFISPGVTALSYPRHDTFPKVFLPYWYGDNNHGWQYAPHYPQPKTYIPELKPKHRYNWKRTGAAFGIGGIAGTAYGVHEVSVHKPHLFPDSWNPYWFDNSLSWPNKYEHGDPKQGPKFFGSTTFLVFVTDAKHASQTVHRVGLLASGAVITFGERRPFWEYCVDFAAGFAGYVLAFHAVYDESLLWR